MTLQMNRRDFMTGAGALVVSVLLPGVPAKAATQASRLALKPDQLSSYISINQDGSAVGWVGKVDMGQGTDIGWIKIIADELDLHPDRVSMVQGHTEETVDQGGASGSTGIWRAGLALRNAAAEARLTLVEMAAAKLGVAADQLVPPRLGVEHRHFERTATVHGDAHGLVPDRVEPQCLGKAPRRVDVQTLVRAWVDGVKAPASVRIQIDIDPYSFM